MQAIKNGYRLQVNFTIDRKYFTQNRRWKHRVMVNVHACEALRLRSGHALAAASCAAVDCVAVDCVAVDCVPTIDPRNRLRMR